MRLSIAALLLGASCVTRTPIGPEEVASLIHADPQHSPFRRTATLELDARELSGNFTLVLVGRTREGGAAELRLQALPEFGPKLMDLVTCQDRVTGYIPMAGESVQYAPEDDAPPPLHLLTFIAASCLERETPLTPERVICAWRGASGEVILEMRGALRAVRIEATLRDGEVVHREYELRGLDWTEDIRGSTRRFRAPGLSWRIEEQGREPLDRLPNGLFELVVPEETTP